MIKNVWELYEKIENFEIDKSIKIPKLYENEESMLWDIMMDGFHKKIPENKKEQYQKRLISEYDAIVKMGFVSYFLILEDLITWTKKTFGSETVGVGRGSAGGSLVNYCLGITDIDPIKHNLLFERFIDIGRKDLPDVDMDFEPRIRESVKQYLIDKYGSDKVVSIGNYQTSKVKGAIKDAARIYNIDFAEVNKVTNAIPYADYVDGDKEFVDHLTYEQLIEMYPELRSFFKKYPDVDTLFKRLRNSIRAIGKHAAGVVVSSVSLNNWIPLMRSKDHIITANTEGGDYHELTGQGFVKFDILGLNNLQVVNDTVRLIKERHKIDIDWNKIDINAPEAYYIAQKGDTLGVFQFESNLVTKTTLNIQPDCFEDLSAINSLIRPGPLNMGMDREFAKRKRAGEYECHESYRHILKDTYGIIVFQEQFMRCFSEIGDFDVIEVNKARKDISKKESSKEAEDKRFERIRSFKEKFVTNASKKMPEEEAIKLWDLIESFGKYGFNKSHSDAYTYTSFRELWLKAHYGIEFYCSLLNNTKKSKEDKHGISAISKCISHINSNPIYYEFGNQIEKRNKVTVLPVDINKSEIEFTIEGENIRFGLGGIKAVSEEAANLITVCRPFKSILDFIRSGERELKNKRLITALIKSGALDSISDGMSRSDMYNVLIQERKYKEDPVNWSLQEIIENEIDYTNISFTEVDYFVKLKSAIIEKYGNKIYLSSLENTLEMENNQSINCLFRITNVEKKKTKGGKKYHVFTVSDGITNLGRVYYWDEAEEDSINSEVKNISENIYFGTINKQNNYFSAKRLKFVRKITI
jgi:DNA polymerase-3 subunit alpha